MQSIICRHDTKAEIAEIIQKFLSDIEYEFPALEMDPNLADHVKVHLKKDGFSDDDISKLARTIQTAVGMSTMTFQTVPFDVKVTIAVYSVYTIFVDDRSSDPEFRKDLDHFNRRLFSGKPQKNILLQAYAKRLSTMHETFGQFGSDMIAKDTIQFLGGNSLEAEPEEAFKWPAEAPEYPYYFRVKNGISEAYAFLLFPLKQFTKEEILRDCLPTITYLVHHFNWTNDILSLYKETMEMDDDNFVNHMAKAEGMTPLEYLRKLSDDTVEVARTLRALGKDNIRLGRALEGSIQGYITFHLTQKRYRLADLGIPLVFEAQERASVLLQ